MSWQKLVLMNYTLMYHADAPVGLVQPLACSEASSEQARGFEFVVSYFMYVSRNSLTNMFFVKIQNTLYV